MRQLASRLGPLLDVTRLTNAFAAIANVWFVILWTLEAGPGLEPAAGALGDTPLWALLLGGTANAVGLYAFATFLNDVLDRRRDQAIHPSRPIPSGRITPDRAIALVIVTFIVAVLGATALGMTAVLATLAIAGVILFLNAIGRFVPAIGLVVLGLVYAGHMLVPNPMLVFVWPVWLVMTHALAVGAITHVLGERIPRLSNRAIVAATIGWLAWSGAIGYLAWTRAGGVTPEDAPPSAPLPSAGGTDTLVLWPEWIEPAGPIAVAILALLFVLLVWTKTRRFGRTQRAARKIARYGALWLALYAIAWLAGQGFTDSALIVLGLAAAGVIGTAIAREGVALVEHPLTYRR